MIIFYACGVAFLVLAVTLRSRLASLATFRLHHLWVVWLALFVQVVVISVLPGDRHTALDAVNLATYGLGATFAWLNRRTPGAWPIFAGGAANVAAITVNHGTMPASRAALIASGWHPAAGHFANSAALAHARLAGLGDIFATPSWLPGHDVFSVGDVLVVVGVVAVMWRACTSPGVRAEPRGRRLRRDSHAVTQRIAALQVLVFAGGVGAAAIRTGVALPWVVLLSVAVLWLAADGRLVPAPARPRPNLA